MCIANLDYFISWQININESELSCDVMSQLFDTGSHYFLLVLHWSIKTKYLLQVCFNQKSIFCQFSWGKIIFFAFRECFHMFFTALQILYPNNLMCIPQLFSLMLHKNASDKFSFESCKFTIQRSKESTGRFVYV